MFVDSQTPKDGSDHNRHLLNMEELHAVFLQASGSVIALQGHITA